MPFDQTSVLSYVKLWPGSVSADTIQTGAAAVYDLELSNSDSVGYWCKLYDAATGSLTIGSSSPTVTIFMPSNTVQPINWAHPRGFGQNCFVSVTANPVFSDTIAPNANKVVISAGYR